MSISGDHPTKKIPRVSRIVVFTTVCPKLFETTPFSPKSSLAQPSQIVYQGGVLVYIRVGHTSLKVCSTNFGHKIVQKSLPKIFINFFRRFLLLKWA